MPRPVAPLDLDLHLDAVTDLVIRAGDLALDWFQRPVDIDNKLADAARASFDPVTEADRAVERALREALAARFPDHEILGEEFGLTGSGDHRWIIDPIDGTRAFITGRPSWGTLLGLRHDGRMRAGWLHNPVLGQTYRGTGDRAELIDRHGTVPLRASGPATLGDAIVLCTHPSMFRPGEQADRFAALGAASRMVLFGGDCMNYASLASGRAGLVVENLLQAYDIAALIPIVEGAGGVVTDLTGASPVEGGYVVAAANPELHAAALDVLAD